MKYDVTTTLDFFTTRVDADSPEDAALRVAKRLHGREVRVRPVNKEASDWWQAYDGPNAVGAAIHVGV